LNIDFHKATNTETVYRQQLKENKQVLKTLKNKLIEVEGVVRDFRLAEKVVALDAHKL
jgi:hypothetical protein